ncbi:MAG: ATP synthase subunit I [Oscillospiraceae bacterium]|nr:ATP synthase subunit I [Oscillospiraceae bacterium]
MDSKKIVLRETAVIAVGELICAALMLCVYAALGYFKLSVLWSALGGCAIMTVNHFFMSATVCLAADRAERGEVDAAKKSVQLSSTVRLICMGLALFVGIQLGADVIALVLPLAFVRPILMVSELFGKKGENGRD